MKEAGPLRDARGAAPGGLRTAPVVDAHVHAFLADMPISRHAWTRPDYGFPAEALLEMLDAHGVLFAVISGLSIAGSYNDYVISALRRHKRLRGTAIVAPTTDRYTLERMANDGIVGIRLQLARQEALPDFDDDDHRLLLRRVRDLDWHVHVAIEGHALRPVLAPLLASGVKVVIDHFGHPDPADPLNCDGYRAMLEAIDTGRTWIKLAAGFRLPGPSAWAEDPDGDLDTLADLVAADLLRRVGPERLLWGSDAPFVGYERRMSYARVLESFYRWVPDEAVRGEMSRTALKLYFT